MIYASEYTETAPNSGARPTKLDYACSDTVYGPYERRGTVIDNEGLDPASWNNHGSVIKVDGTWYVFYHASSNNSAFSRRARVERLDVDEASGFIRQAVPTTNGFVQTLTPAHIVSPVNACRFFGGAFVTQTQEGVFPCEGLQTGAGFAFSQIRFARGNYTLTLQYQATAPTRVRLFLDMLCTAEQTLPPCTEIRNETIAFHTDAGCAPLRLEIADDGDGTCVLYALKIELPTGQTPPQNV